MVSRVKYHYLIILHLRETEGILMKLCYFMQDLEKQMNKERKRQQEWNKRHKEQLGLSLT